MRNVIVKEELLDDKSIFSTDHLRAGLRGRALRGASATMLAQTASFGIQTVGTVIMARLLTPEDYGMVTMVLAFSLLLQNFGVNGFTEAIIQKKEISHEQISTLFWINILFSILLAILFVLSAPVISWFYKEPRLEPIVFAIALSIIFAGLSVQHLALLKRSMRFSLISLNDIVAATISTTIPIFLAWQGFGYWSLVVKWVSLPLAITVGAWILCGWRPGLPARRTGVGPMLRYAFHTYGNFVMNYFRRNIDKMLIGQVFGSQSLGMYDRAYHLSNMPVNQVINPVYTVAVSTFSRLTDDPERYRANYLKVLSILALVGMPLSGILTLVAHDVMLLFLGPQWTKAGEIFFAFGLSIGVMILYLTHGWLHLSLGTPDRWFRWSIVEFIATVLCMLVGLAYGPLGVAAAFSVSFYILLCPALVYAGRPVQLKLTAIISSVWKYGVLSLVAAVLSWFLVSVNDATAAMYSDSPVLIRIFVSAGLCLSLYLLLILVFMQRTRPIGQLIAIVRDMIPKSAKNE
jgi:O-antigen/teichoic acid export membrane protein